MGGGVYLCYWEGCAKTCGLAKIFGVFGRRGVAVGFRVVFVGSRNVVENGWVRLARSVGLYLVYICRGRSVNGTLIA